MERAESRLADVRRRLASGESTGSDRLDFIMNSMPQWLRNPWTRISIQSAQLQREINSSVGEQMLIARDAEYRVQPDVSPNREDLMPKVDSRFQVPAETTDMLLGIIGDEARFEPEEERFYIPLDEKLRRVYGASYKWEREEGDVYLGIEDMRPLVDGEVEIRAGDEPVFDYFRKHDDLAYVEALNLLELHGPEELRRKFDEHHGREQDRVLEELEILVQKETNGGSATVTEIRRVLDEAKRYGLHINGTEETKEVAEFMETVEEMYAS